MSAQLEKLLVDLASYRQAVDQIFSPLLKGPKEWRERLFEVLICTSQLYLDYLLIIKSLPIMEVISSESGSSNFVRTNLVRERNLRERLKHKLESSRPWSGFRPENPFSGITGLCSRQDYIDRFTLHLPEIYEETFQVEACTKNYLLSHNGAALAQLGVGLQHLGRNHISFVLQPLEWAADADSWDELPIGATS